MADSVIKSSKTERSWIFYDWANSVYATNIMAAIFPIEGYHRSTPQEDFAPVAEYQKQAKSSISAVCNGSFGGADVEMQYWGYGTSAATLIVALGAPILGAIGWSHRSSPCPVPSFLAASPKKPGPCIGSALPSGCILICVEGFLWGSTLSRPAGRFMPKRCSKIPFHLPLRWSSTRKF